MKQKAIVLGASGLIGGHVLTQLLSDDSFDKVSIFVRKPLAVEHSKLEQHIVDFSNLDAIQEFVVGDVLFSCLGTTIKKAGSQEAFTKVDYDYPLAFAKLSKKNGVKKVLLVSSVGADASSNNFYLKTKGILEDGLIELKFAASVFSRPSMLMGDRKEFRLGEVVGSPIMRLFSVLFVGKLSNYKAINARDVATALVRNSKKEDVGNKILFYNQMVY